MKQLGVWIGAVIYGRNRRLLPLVMVLLGALAMRLYDDNQISQLRQSLKSAQENSYDLSRQADATEEAAQEARDQTEATEDAVREARDQTEAIEDQTREIKRAEEQRHLDELIYHH